MIKVNLLPQELRKEKTGTPRFPYIPLAILAGVLFLLMTFFFYGDYLRARSAYNSVKKEWAGLNPSLAQLKAMESKVDVEMKGEKEFLEKNVLNTESMTQILMWVSEYLPAKGWLTGLKAEREIGGFRLTLRGVVLATRSQTGIEQIEEYFRKLRAQLPPQNTLALTTSKDPKAQGEGTSFVANLEWKAGQKT